MNNEEKILEMLTMLQSEMGAMRSEMDAMRSEMDARFARLEAVQSKQGEQLAQINDRLEELDDRSLRSAVMLENQVLPQLQLLYEGQVTLQQTLAPKERVEVLEDDVITLKTVVKSISNRLAALEKAQ